jgi:3D (Asp-Asp-Asp) domain-containing protein
MRITTLSLLLVTAIAARSSAAASGPQEPRKLARVVLTFYWLIDESSSKYSSSTDAVLLDTHGRTLARTSRRFRKELVMEGTGRLRDGRVVAYERRLRGTSRFRVVHSQYGNSSRGCPLVPYRTIAVDPRVATLGSTIYIPQLKGTILPDGTVHDGMFIADDRGHFRGHLVDVFTGVGPTTTRPFIHHGNRSRSHVALYLVAGPRRRRCH